MSYFFSILSNMIENLTQTFNFQNNIFKFQELRLGSCQGLTSWVTSNLNLFIYLFTYLFIYLFIHLLIIGSLLGTQQYQRISFKNEKGIKLDIVNNRKLT